MTIRILALKASKLIYFIALFIGVGHAMPKPYEYINYDLQAELCVFLYGDRNADTMYDTSFYIDMSAILIITIIIHIITIKLIKRIRSK